MIFAGGCLASCGPTAADPCLTYRVLQPSQGTVDYIVENDVRFAEDLLVHNEVWSIYCR